MTDGTGIRSFAAELESGTCLSRRQSQSLACLYHGMTVADTVEFYQGEWGVNGNVTESQVLQALSGACSNISEARNTVAMTEEVETHGSRDVPLSVPEESTIGEGTDD